MLICYDCNLVENVRDRQASWGRKLLLAPHQTGGCDYNDNTNIMGRIDPAKWQNRRHDPSAIEAEFRGPKGAGELTTCSPCRA